MSNEIKKQLSVTVRISVGELDVLLLHYTSKLLASMWIHHIQSISQDIGFFHDTYDNPAPSWRNTVDDRLSQSQAVAEAVPDQESRWRDTSSRQKLGVLCNS